METRRQFFQASAAGGAAVAWGSFGFDLAPAYAEVTQRLLDRCEALGISAYAAATFVEMHFAGLPVLPAPEPALELVDPDASPNH